MPKNSTASLFSVITIERVTWNRELSVGIACINLCVADKLYVSAQGLDNSAEFFKFVLDTINVQMSQ